jgi:hypothetical protein
MRFVWLLEYFKAIKYTVYNAQILMSRSKGVNMTKAGLSYQSFCDHSRNFA